MNHHDQMGIVSPLRIIRLLLLLFVAIFRSDPATAERLTPQEREQLNNFGISPGIINDSPSFSLTVFYEASGYRADFALSPQPAVTDVALQPRVTFKEAEASTYYTLIMMDPDAPSPENPTLGPILHYGVCNIEGSNVETGTQFASYQPPTPLSKAPHRYIFVFHEQPKKIKNCDPNGVPLIARTNFAYKQYVKEKRLKKVMAINFFLAARD